MPGPDTPAGTVARRRMRRGEAAWIVLLAGAVLLPTASTAAWLGATYTATPAQVTAGVLLLKGSLVLLCVAALVVGRLPAAEAAPVRRASSGGPWWPIVAIAVVAVGLRLYRIDSGLWVDEIEMLVRYVPLEFRQLVSTYDTQNHHPLYTLLAHGSWSLGAGADWTVRVPAVVFGVASVVTLQRFGRTIVSDTEATLAALVLAVSYHHVWFSQNARGYTLILCLTIAATGVFLALQAGGRARPHRLAWGYAILMALATYTHLTAALVAVGHGIALVATASWRTREGRSRLVWPVVALALSALLTLSLYAPMLPQVVREVTTPTTSVQTEWSSARWMLTEGLRSLAGGVPGGLPAALVAIAVLGAGLSSLWRESRTAVLTMFLPVVVTAAAVVATGHNLWPRFFFFAAGFLVLAAIRGGFAGVQWLVRWQPRRVAVAGAAAVALLSLVTVPRAWEPKQQFRAALDYVERERVTGDAVVAVDVASYVYLLREWAPTWIFTNGSAALADVERTAQRTWVVYTLPTRIRGLYPDLWQQISPPRYDTARVFSATVGGGEIHVLRRDQPARND